MIRRILLVVVAWSELFIGYNCLDAADVSEQRKTELLLAIGRNSFERVDNLPMDEKRWLLEYIRNKRKEPSYGAAYELQLIQLGDEEAMNRCVTGFDEHLFRSLYLPDSRQPRLIERMAPTMYHDEPSSYPQTGDMTIYPRSINAAALVAHLLSTSHEIPDAVRRWAEESLKAADDPALQNRDIGGKMRSAMRQWWLDNEYAMRTRNWAAVRPGPGIIASGQPASSPPDVNASEPRPLGERQTPGVKKDVGRAAGNEAPRGLSTWVWCSITAGIAFLLGVAFGIKVRQKRDWKQGQ